MDVFTVYNSDVIELSKAICAWHGTIESFLQFMYTTILNQQFIFLSNYFNQIICVSVIFFYIKNVMYVHTFSVCCIKRIHWKKKKKEKKEKSTTKRSFIEWKSKIFSINTKSICRTHWCNTDITITIKWKTFFLPL